MNAWDYALGCHVHLTNDLITYLCEMYKHQFTKRIRYGETDRMGYLYYGHYAMLYEIGRTESFRSLGLNYKILEDEYGIMMPVLSVESRFLKPILYDELITIETILSEMPEKMASFKTNIYNTEGELAHKGLTKLFFVDTLHRRRVATPEYIMDKLKPYFGR